MSDEPKPFSWWNFLPANWQQIVGWLILCACSVIISLLSRWGIVVPPAPIPVFVPPPDGWVKPRESEIESTRAALRVARFANTEAGQQVVGDADAPLWRLAFKARGGPIPDRNQGQVGSCVSFGFAAAGEYTMAAQVAIGKARQDLPDMATEPIYAGSRVEVNGGRVPFNGDGSTGAWAAKWIETRGGYLPRKVYGSHDLTAYSESRARQWGDRGVPDELEPEAQRHKANCTLVASAAEAKTALAQGYAISVCSDQGFATERDSDGFAAPRGSWAHCMAIIGYRSDKPGFLILNSWGSDWIRGPKGKFADIPDGSFWADERTVDRMLRQQDSYAVANAEGFVRRKIDPADWIVTAPRREHNARNILGVIHVLAP